MCAVFTPPSGLLRQKHVYDDDEADLFVWDILDPFAPPEPSQARLRALIQAEIERTRRYESIGPLQSLPDPVQDPLDGWYDSESESESGADDVDDDADDEDSEPDSDDSDGDDDHDSAADKPNVIALPQLLPIPLRFLPNPFDPPPSPRSRFSDTSSVDDRDGPTLWSEVYDDIAEAEERAARKAKRDAYRSRLKALAILGPEAASALPPLKHTWLH